ncbi:hypothetical protein ACFR99_14575 [Haloarchaeobius amylolyticus]|uniref:Uncharacterized protein n=1 Tax=Haloarchaeobius amylolyticus TaxID=1198296 RepID=A0ABD6BKW6_9EURY
MQYICFDCRYLRVSTDLAQILESAVVVSQQRPARPALRVFWASD